MPQMIPVFKTRAVATLLVGLFFCGSCALFPPRRNRNDQPQAVARVFLLNPEINLYKRRVQGGEFSNVVEIDSGRLLAECIGIACLTGFVSLCFCLEYWQWKIENEPGS